MVIRSLIACMTAALAAGGCVPDPAALANPFQVTASVERTEQAIHCEIRSNRGFGNADIRAVISADHAVEGRFRLLMTKTGKAGQSRIVQRGDFVLSAGEAEAVGRALIGPGKENIRAELTVMSSTGERLCKSVFPEQKSLEPVDDDVIRL
ncbi:MAG: curli-like amyloid fiber formation chaperone CsgH [Pseudomonadota bacterium]